MKKIYCVVVTYNGSKWIEQCLGSLLKSTISIKVIVIDNGSSDRTIEIMQQNFPDVEISEAHQNLGFGKANNIGIKKAYDSGADYVFLVNQDARVEPNTIEKLVNAAERSPEYGIVSPVHLNGSGDQLDLNFSHYIAPQYCPNLYSDMWTSQPKNRVYKVHFVNAAAWLMSRHTIETVGGFNSIFFHYGEDENYIHRLRYHGLELGVFPHASIYHDREERPPSIYIADPLQAELRAYMIRYSNPAEQEPVKDCMARLYKEFVKNILMFRLRQALHFLKLARDLRKNASQIENSKQHSKESGLHFL